MRAVSTESDHPAVSKSQPTGTQRRLPPATTLFPSSSSSDVHLCTDETGRLKEVKVKPQHLSLRFTSLSSLHKRGHPPFCGYGFLEKKENLPLQALSRSCQCQQWKHPHPVSAHKDKYVIRMCSVQFSRKAHVRAPIMSNQT